MKGPPKTLRQRDSRLDFILKRTDFLFFYTVYKFNLYAFGERGIRTEFILKHTDFPYSFKFNMRSENEVSGPSLY